jgi:2-polyprenyl-3-methyl-5-hydroxy-6-metoxy-1,4-benzoquinol methylase
MMELESETPGSMAGLETHEKVLELVAGYFGKPARFIDLGAGQGAFARNLQRLGHRVVAVDANARDWKVPEIELIEADLDAAFSANVNGSGEKFDAAVAIEIIEHIENPFNFAREAAKLLKPGGHLFLTTPNVEAVSSRLIFLYTGRLKYFGAYETVRPAHITPIFRWKLEMLLAEAGFEIVEETFNRMSYETGVNFKSRIAALVGRLIAPVVKGEKGGESRIVVARLK